MKTGLPSGCALWSAGKRWRHGYLRGLQIQSPGVLFGLHGVLYLFANIFKSGEYMKSLTSGLSWKFVMPKFPQGHSWLKPTITVGTQPASPLHWPPGCVCVQLLAWNQLESLKGILLSQEELWT